MDLVLRKGGLCYMRIIQCSNCGANGLVERNGCIVCEYCDSKFIIESSDFPQKSMGMSLNADIENLLQRCRTDPKNARRYANRVLDIDPTNLEALKYI